MSGDKYLTPMGIFPSRPGETEDPNLLDRVAKPFHNGKTLRITGFSFTNLSMRRLGELLDLRTYVDTVDLFNCTNIDVDTLLGYLRKRPLRRLRIAQCEGTWSDFHRLTPDMVKLIHFHGDVSSAVIPILSRRAKGLHVYSAEDYLLAVRAAGPQLTALEFPNAVTKSFLSLLLRTNVVETGDLLYDVKIAHHRSTISALVALLSAERGPARKLNDRSGDGAILRWVKRCLI